MAARIVLHIGTHKTGSTSLQSFLLERTDLLERVDAWYPPGFALPTAHAELPLLAIDQDRMWPARLRLPEVCDPAWLSAARRHVLEQLASATRGTLVYSHEDLSYVRSDAEVARLCELLSPATVEVVVYLRDRVRFLASYRAQLEAAGFPLSDDAASFAYVEQDSWLVDYDALVGVYRRGFGDPNVHVLDYDAVMSNDGSVIPAFTDIIGLPRDALPPLEAYYLNARGRTIRPTGEQLAAVRRRLAEQARG